ncbi:MAG: DUF3556 domain-containing protein [Deltaproteobacteria bacterium]|nr:DUF3556 domain-containing protein [Deltaproteobacteria bacterium]
MGFLDPTPPPYAPLEWLEKPLTERGQMVCAAWAMQGYGTPPAVFVAYALKVVVYVAAWMGFCTFSPSLGRPLTIETWWLHPLAFEKAIVWSMLFEVLGLGCGSGPLTGRYLPPLGGFLYFLRPGTTKLPFFAGAPLIGNRTRGLLDVGLYAALVVASLRALLAPELGASELLPLVVLVPLLGILDKTLFLAARAEHYWVTIVCFAFASDWIPAAKAVQLALWFWAGFSKLNHHFPPVTCVMTSNSPVMRFGFVRRRMYVDYPRDLRPSRLAQLMAHLGTALELGVPLAFLLTPLHAQPVVAIALMLMLHSFITSNVPMGVPIEWNVMVVYGGFALFWAHPDASLLAIGPPALAAFLVLMLLVLPLAGNLFPEHISFLLAMRYYAGNWAYSVWLFRGDAYRKLSKMKMSSAWIYDQLAHFYDRATSVGLLGKVMAFRMMHLHGRALPRLVPKAVERVAEHEWLDGELVAGLVLGWNFGEGHLHQEQLLASVQAQCGFEPGELRCIFVESQPLGRSTLAYRIADASTGVLERGTLDVGELRAQQPWEAPR